MIESFRHKGLKRLFEGDDRRQLRPDLVERIRIILAALDAANAVDAIEQAELPASSPQRRLEGLLGCYGARELAHRVSL